ncbi:MAG: restriction endonuclease subunit S [Candidatus Aenigmarchaeota archaeon]|nr:restriction endonuclease subunit S [Candidatus Aenigmarchaeota archaeon]
MIPKTLPEGWKVVEFSKICSKLKSGGTPLTSKLEYYNGEIPFVKIEDISKAKKYLTKTKIKITEKGLKNSNAWLVPKNSLLLAIYGSLGEVAINKIEVATNQAILGVVLDNNKGDTEYIYYLFTFLRKYLERQAKHTTQANLTAEIIKKLKIPLPPLPEQKKIAEILSTVDKAIQNVDEIIAKTERLKKGLMQELLTKGVIYGFMFDTNIFDAILDNKIKLKSLLSHFNHYITHIQKDEIDAITKPEKLERKKKLLELFKELKKDEKPTESFVFGTSKLGKAKLKEIPTESSVWDISRWNKSKWSNGDLYRNLLTKLKELDKKAGKKKTKENKIRDVLIAETCIKNNSILVTEDKNLKEVTLLFGGQAITFEQFLKGEYKEFKNTEIGKIPKDWEVVKFEDVAKIRGNRSISDVEKVSFIPMELISESEIFAKYQVKNIDEIKSFTYCEAGDILLAKITPSLENGKQGMVPNDVLNGFALATTEVFPIKCNTIDRLFLFYILKFSKFRNVIIASMTGTTGRQRASKQVVENLKIPLPSFSEQRKIAEILLTVDKKLELERKRKEKLERIKKGLMNDLLTGRKRVKI